MNKKAIIISLALVGLGVRGSAAEETVCSTKESPKPGNSEASWCQNSKNWLRLYHNPESSWLNEFRFTGRAQYQMGWVDTRQQTYSNSYGRHDEWRRVRLGAQAKVFRDFKLVNNWDIGGFTSIGAFNAATQQWENREGVNNLFEMYVGWEKYNWGVRVGKFLPGITAEYRQSSATMKYVEYAAVVNQLRPQSYGSNFGVELVYGCEKASPWGAKLIFAGTQTAGEYYERPEWSSQDSMILGEVSKKVDGWPMETGRVYLDYGHNFSDMSDTKAIDRRNYVGIGAQDVVSLSYEGKQDKWSLMADLIGGFNPRDLKAEKAGSHVWGVVVTPSYRISPHWEGVMRYQWATGTNAVLLNPRYSKLVRTGGGYVDGLLAGSVGLNFLLCPENPGMGRIMFEVGYIGTEGGRLLDKKQPGMDGWQYVIAFRTNF